MMRDRHHEWREPDTYIEFCGGAGPVQAWGPTAGKRFYFRARHDAWSFAAALDQARDPFDIQVPGAGFLVEDRYGSDEAASYMVEEEAAAIIRRCIQRFREPVVREGTFLRQSRGKGYGARVTVRLDLTAPAQAIHIACQGPRVTGRQGEIIDVPAEGFEAWKHGAGAGIAFALARADNPIIEVTVTQIQGLVTDTNPTIVGAAAINAVWMALQIEPEVADRMHISQTTLDSWDQPVDALPHW